MAVLIIAEHHHQALQVATLSVVTAALALSPQVDVMVLGDQTKDAVNECQTIAGVRCVIDACEDGLTYPSAESVAPLVVANAGDYTHILVAATSWGKSILPRVAALLDVVQLSDVTRIIDHETFEHPIYAGNAIETVRVLDAQKVLSIRPTAFDKASSVGGSASVKSAKLTGDKTQGARFVSLTQSKGDRPELTDARVVVAGGRALQSADNFSLIADLADCLGGAVGATRAAVDAGYISNDCQVGQTGKIVAPDLYIAVGISGAIQHLAGMKDSKVIVAINKDPDAPIFQVADYGLVGDLFQIIPELTQKLRAKKAA